MTRDHREGLREGSRRYGILPNALVERDVVEKDLVGKNLVPFGPFDPDIPPGMVGVDGTVTLVSGFTALGWGAGVVGTEVVNGDGTVTVNLDAAGGAANFTNPLSPPSPIPSAGFEKSIDVRCRLVDPTKDVRVQAFATDGHNPRIMILVGGGGLGNGTVEFHKCVANAPHVASLNINLGTMRTYSMLMPGDQGDPTLLIDGVPQVMAYSPAGGFCTSGGPFGLLVWDMFNNDAASQGVVVDFLRWTAPV